jgi:carbon storage regulator CsrA
MLVLARKLDESIVIGEDITVKIIAIEKGVVKLGIDAPSDISIVRNELIEDVTDANKAAVKDDVSTHDLNILSKMLKK